MKKLFVFFLLSTSFLRAQSPVGFRIAANGKVQINAGINQTWLPFFTPVYATDSLFRSIYKTNTPEKKQQANTFIGSGSTWNFTHYSIQSYGLPSIYPIINQWETNYFYWTKNEPQEWRLEYGKSQYGGCGSHTWEENYGYFQEWHLGKNKRVEKIIVGKISSDTMRKKLPVKEYTFLYDQSGKIVRKTAKVSGGNEERSCEITEFVYDNEGHLIAECEYEKQRPITHLTDSIVAWKKQLEYILLHGNKVNHSFDARETPVYTLHFYTYENHLLRSTLGYSNAASFISTDSLSYDDHGNLTRLAIHPGSDWREFTFAYDTTGEKLLFRREYWHSDCADQGCDETIFHENYSYSPSGNISKLVYETEGRINGEGATEEFFYSGK